MIEASTKRRVFEARDDRCCASNEGPSWETPDAHRRELGAALFDELGERRSRARDERIETDFDGTEAW